MEVSAVAAYVQPAPARHDGPLRLKSDGPAGCQRRAMTVCVCVLEVKGLLPVRVCLDSEPEELEWSRFYLRV